MKNFPVKKNSEYTVEIIDLTHEGLGVAKIDGYPLFIENALPDEKLLIKVIKVGKQFGYGKVVELYEASPNRVEPKDKALTQAGISPLQHMSYSAQLEFKTNQVKNVMQRIAKMPEIPVLDTLGMENPWAYRNKAQIPVRKINEQLETGFFRKNSHELIPIENFYIQDPEIDKAIVIVREIMKKYRVKPYNEEDNTGNLRHIIIRRGYHTGEMSIALVTRTAKLFQNEKIVADILSDLPNVVSIVQSVHPEKNNVIFGEELIVLYGEDSMKDRIFDLTFEMSAESFYQINPQQTEVMYNKVKEYADLTGNEVVVDAYCGIGTIGLTLAKNAKEVYGIEVVASAIKNAKNNVKINQIENTLFFEGSAEKRLPQLIYDGIHPDVIVVDPPRKGLDKELIASIVTTKPEKVIYVSCNPATLARDIALFAEGGYKTEEIQPIDNFPQTAHVEAVALLKRQ